MKIAIVGSRDYPQLEDVHFWFPKLFDGRKDTLLSGGARGVDKEAEKVALWMNVPIVFYRPERKHVKSDYIKRNIKMVDDADVVYGFFDGTSKGTWFTLKYAAEKGKLGGFWVKGKRFLKPSELNGQV